ncbi:hypothetical protein BLEM_0600 [Bifidobacterium lemurum]|uniref:Terminase n=1 Tax=Bifidobacterium lemurum TaxID=1603886 RepID=A0A261FUS6_9BIFI|nr:hypothetical protein [Bifidobacterium lemurum]OZG62683.1 hypothetical protein BLEM_0600 [Bifidobacterium lemurum]QOL34600.1 hypothetical protein BL8807_01300 [Bifidobacterium lemurum]
MRHEAEPRYLTPRDESLDTDGGAVAAVSEALGHPLLPWQRLVADIAGEYRVEDGRKILTHPRVIVTVPRQAGKTTLDEARHIRSLLMGPNRMGWYIAQRGMDATARFKQVVKDIQKSPALAPLLADVKYSAGDMGLTLANGSVFRPSPPTDSAGHGFQGDMITLDEAWAFDAKTGQALLQAFVPTTITRLQLMGQQPQLVIMSTEGTADSTFLNPMLTECRRGLAPKSWAFIDYGLGLDDDPEDLDAVWRSHPGAGHLFNRRQLQGFRDEFKGSPTGWRRAFCNIRDDGSNERVYTQDLWDISSCEPIDLDGLEPGTFAFGVAVDIDQSATSVAVAHNGKDGLRAGMVRVLPGTAGALELLADLSDRYHAPIALDPKGPTAPLADRLRHDGVCRLADLPATELGMTGLTYLEMLRQGTAFHAPDERLDQSVAVAVRRWAGDTWYLDRRQSPGDVSPIEAVQLAAWAALHPPKRVRMMLF